MPPGRSDDATLSRCLIFPGLNFYHEVRNARILMRGPQPFPGAEFVLRGPFLCVFLSRRTGGSHFRIVSPCRHHLIRKCKWEEKSNSPMSLKSIATAPPEDLDKEMGDFLDTYGQDAVSICSSVAVKSEAEPDRGPMKPEHPANTSCYHAPSTVDEVDSMDKSSSPPPTKCTTPPFAYHVGRSG